MKIDEVNFDAYDDDIEYKKQKSRSPRAGSPSAGNESRSNALEIVIKKQQCTEIGCFTMTHSQCKHCSHFKCDKHLKKLCLFGPFCAYCHKRKQYITIGSVICVLVILTLIFYLLHTFGVYS